MLYFIGVIVLILTYVFFSNFILGYKIDKKFNPIIIHGSDTIGALISMPYSSGNIMRSEDKRTGIEFSYTTWLKINDNIGTTKYYNVFLKGSMQNDSLKPTQCPGVWIKKKVGEEEGKNVNNIELIINFDTFLVKDKDTTCTGLTNECDTHDYCETNSEYKDSCHNRTHEQCEKKRECKFEESTNREKGECLNTCTNKSKETIKLDNIPFKRWFHLAIIVRNKEIDVYVNGNLYDTFKLKGVIKQNHNDLLFGFSDNINSDTLHSTVMSDFRYFNYAIPYYRLDNLLRNSKDNLKVPVEKEVEFKPYLNRKYWTQEDTDLNTYGMETNID